MAAKNGSLSGDEILNFMAEYGRAYMSAGGPTSRLEDSLSSLGRKLGFPTEVYATPTGIFLSCMTEQRSNHTTLCRIKDGGMNLGRLVWLESIFEDVQANKISIAQANKILLSKHIRKPTYSMRQKVLACFLAGVALSYPSFGKFNAAIASGIIAIAAWMISGPSLKDRIPSSIFRDFIGCAVTLALSAVCILFIPGPFEAFSIGGLVVLVPGLALTTAISELADQNLVSGTAKLMQAVLTLLALGIAYMLFTDLSSAMGFTHTFMAQKAALPVGASVLCALISVSCFCVIFNVPRKSLPWATLTGLLGWGILRQFSTGEHIVAASYLASLAVGLVAMFLGSRFKVPSQVFSVPGILAMLPGMLALTSLRTIAMGQEAGGVDLGFRVAITAGSIVFGLFTARLPFAIKSKT